MVLIIHLSLDGGRETGYQASQFPHFCEMSLGLVLLLFVDVVQGVVVPLLHIDAVLISHQPQSWSRLVLVGSVSKA